MEFWWNDTRQLTFKVLRPAAQSKRQEDLYTMELLCDRQTTSL